MRPLQCEAQDSSFYCCCVHRHLHSFPTRRSSDLAVSRAAQSPSTTSVERQNLTRRVSMRRFTRLTNAFLKKRSEEHTSELQSRFDLVCRLLLEKKEINEFIAELFL